MKAGESLEACNQRLRPLGADESILRLRIDCCTTLLANMLAAVTEVEAEATVVMIAYR